MQQKSYVYVFRYGWVVTTAQIVRHCGNIMGSDPVEVPIFFSVLICNCLNCNYHALQRSYLHLDVPPTDDTISWDTLPLSAFLTFCPSKGKNEAFPPLPPPSYVVPLHVNWLKKFIHLFPFYFFHNLGCHSSWYVVDSSVFQH